MAEKNRKSSVALRRWGGGTGGLLGHGELPGEGSILSLSFVAHVCLSASCTGLGVVVISGLGIEHLSLLELVPLRCAPLPMSALQSHREGEEDRTFRVEDVFGTEDLFSLPGVLRASRFFDGEEL